MIHCNIKTCVGCRMCEVACSSSHFGAVAPGLARIRVAKLEETGLDLAVACVSCVGKPCLECPTGALSARADGVITVEAELCNACRTCVDACPIGAVGFYQDRPLFCDLCHGDAACVRACPSGSLHFREDYREVSLTEFLSYQGYPGQKRAAYALFRGAPLRAAWKIGERVEP